VTVTRPSAGGFVTVYPSGVARPVTSTQNFVAGQTRANRAIVAVGPDGKVNIFNSTGRTDVVIDVSGWFTNASSAAGGATFVPLSAPRRLADSRPGAPAPNTPWGPGMSRSIMVAGSAGVPMMAGTNAPTALLANVTETNATVGGYLTAFPSGAHPLASDLNFSRGQTLANMAVVRLAPNGSMTVFNFSGRVDVIVDVFGWFAR
jgi:hypothetical protein